MPRRSPLLAAALNWRWGPPYCPPGGKPINAARPRSGVLHSSLGHALSPSAWIQQPDAGWTLPVILESASADPLQLPAFLPLVWRLGSEPQPPAPDPAIALELPQGGRGLQSLVAMTIPCTDDQGLTVSPPQQARPTEHS